MKSVVSSLWNWCKMHIDWNVIWFTSCSAEETKNHHRFVSHSICVRQSCQKERCKRKKRLKNKIIFFHLRMKMIGSKTWHLMFARYSVQSKRKTNEFANTLVFMKTTPFAAFIPFLLPNERSTNAIHFAPANALTFSRRRNLLATRKSFISQVKCKYTKRKVLREKH